MMRRFWLVLALCLTVAAPTLAEAAGLMSHRAIYRMSLDGAAGDSDVVAADGMMMYRFAEVCDGWTVENRTYLRLRYERGTDSETVWTFVSWEAEDGLRFRFNARYEQDGNVIEKLKGEASLKPGGGGGSARFSLPSEEVVELPPGAMFPTEHMLSLIATGLAGKKILDKVVFDGSSRDNPYRVNAIMAALPAENAEALAKAAGLPPSPAWWVRMAFFPFRGAETLPEFELGARYREDGVADEISQHFEDFSLVLRLKEFEELPKPDC
jgi:hypothetical protein